MITIKNFLIKIIIPMILILSKYYSINLKVIKSQTKRRKLTLRRHKVTINGGIQRMMTGTSTKFSKSLKFKKSLRVKVLRTCHTVQNLTMTRIFNRQSWNTMIPTKKSLKKLNVLKTKSESQLRIYLWLNWRSNRWSSCSRTATWTRLL